MDKRKIYKVTIDENGVNVNEKEIDITNLKIGDIFRMEESDGTPVQYEKFRTMLFKAISTPEKTDKGYYGVDIIPYHFIMKNKNKEELNGDV